MTPREICGKNTSVDLHELLDLNQPPPATGNTQPVDVSRRGMMQLQSGLPGKEVMENWSGELNGHSTASLAQRETSGTVNREEQCPLISKVHQNRDQECQIENKGKRILHGPSHENMTATAARTTRKIRKNREKMKRSLEKLREFIPNCSPNESVMSLLDKTIAYTNQLQLQTQMKSNIDFSPFFSGAHVALTKGLSVHFGMLDPVFCYPFSYPYPTSLGSPNAGGEDSTTPTGQANDLSQGQGIGSNF